MMTKDGLIFEANSLKQGWLQALTRQQLQAQATQNRERRWGSPTFPGAKKWVAPSAQGAASAEPAGILIGECRASAGPSPFQVRLPEWETPSKGGPLSPRRSLPRCRGACVLFARRMPGFGDVRAME